MGNGSSENTARLLPGESNIWGGGGGGERYTALADGPPRSAGFILSRGEGHELSKDEQIRVFANEVKSRPAPAEHAGQQRTEARRVVRNTAQTF